MTNTTDTGKYQACCVRSFPYVYIRDLSSIYDNNYYYSQYYYYRSVNITHSIYTCSSFCKDHSSTCKWYYSYYILLLLALPSFGEGNRQLSTCQWLKECHQLISGLVNDHPILNYHLSLIAALSGEKESCRTAWSNFLNK